MGEQQAPVSKASEADVAADSKDERPKSRSRSRSRSSSKPKDEVKADAPETVTETKPEAKAKPEPKAKSEPKAKPEPRAKPEPKASEAASHDQSRDTQPRSRGGKGRGRNEDRGPKVVGLGDHLPTFIEKSFADRRTD